MGPSDLMVQKGHYSYQKYHLTKMAKTDNSQKTCTHKNISQKWHLTTYFILTTVFQSTTNTLLIEPNPTIRHRLVKVRLVWSGKNSILNSHDHESLNKCKNSVLKITQFIPWQIIFGHFFAKVAIFVKHHFFSVSYLSVSGGVFVTCHFCKVPLFSNGFKGCLFWWVSYLLGVSDGDVKVFYSYVHKEIP